MVCSKTEYFKGVELESNGGERCDVLESTILAPIRYFNVFKLESEATLVATLSVNCVVKVG